MCIRDRTTVAIQHCLMALPGASLDSICLLYTSTLSEPVIRVAGSELAISDLAQQWEGTLESVYPTDAKAEAEAIPNVDCAVRLNKAPAVKIARPKAVIPVFPGTNCEYDTANACLRAGIDPEILVIRNLTTELLTESASALEQAIQGARCV